MIGRRSLSDDQADAAFRAAAVVSGDVLARYFAPGIFERVIGAMTMRFGRVRPLSLNGANNGAGERDMRNLDLE